MDKDFNLKHIKVLINAFQKDPMFVALFKGQKKERQMIALFKFVYIRNKLTNGLFITDSNENPSYVAFVETPKDAQKTSIFNMIRLNLEMLKLMFYMPFKNLQFLSKYDATTMKHRPNENHYYLTMIAVSPEKQGRGVGKKVINSIHNMVINDSTARRIYLDTENMKNVSYYERLGYELICEEKVASVPIYCMKKSFS